MSEEPPIRRRRAGNNEVHGEFIKTQEENFKGFRAQCAHCGHIMANNAYRLKEHLIACQAYQTAMKEQGRVTQLTQLADAKARGEAIQVSSVRAASSPSVASPLPLPFTPDRRIPDYMAESSSNTTPASGSKPVVEIRIWVIKSRVPYISQETWRGGKFGGMTLPEVFETVSRACRLGPLYGRPPVEELRFMLQTCEKQCNDSVRRDDVARYHYMKRIFDDEIKRAFAKDRNQLRAFEIFIEPADQDRNVEDGQGEMEDAVLQEWL